MERCLQEFRVRGVKTNIPFLLEPGHAPEFLAGDVTTRFLDETPELFQLPDATRPGEPKLLAYIAEIIVNGHPEVRKPKVAGTRRAGTRLVTLRAPPAAAPLPKGTRDTLQGAGAGEVRQVGARAEAAARHRHDDARCAPVAASRRGCGRSTCSHRADRYAAAHADLFSLEMWGGATFDTAMRFLKESPWDRLARLRDAVPNILFQMLLRAANAVGYTNYPDNVVYEFVKESAQAGIDVFRIFDALNWLPNIKLGDRRGAEDERSICEAAICYTGDILDPKRDKYSLDVLRQSREGTGEARHALPRHQGHGRAAQAVRREEAREGAARGGRRADPLPHARLGRRADRVVPDGRGGGRGHRRLRVRADGRASPASRA